MFGCRTGLGETSSRRVKPLADIHSETETRGIALSQVGVRGVSAWLFIADPLKTYGPLPVSVDVGVALDSRKRAAHLSRLGEAVTSLDGHLALRTLPAWLTDVTRRLESQNGSARFAFPLLFPREAPVSRAMGLLRIEAEAAARVGAGEPQLWQTVRLPVQTLCPCSKAMSDRGAHNQRCLVTLSVRSVEGIAYADLVARVEATGSCEIYPILKREDERYVTERAYARPAFVEDLARDLIGELRGIPGLLERRIEVVSQESIHPHDAFAVVEA
jgi:GTP cyclohydrolase I